MFLELLSETADRNFCSISSFQRPDSVDRVNRTQRQSGQGSFSGFRPWPTKWQASAYPVRSALSQREICCVLRSNDARAAPPDHGQDAVHCRGPQMPKRLYSGHLRAVNTWRRPPGHNMFMPLMDQRDWLRFACSQPARMSAANLQIEVFAFDSTVMQIDWHGRPLQHHCFK